MSTPGVVTRFAPSPTGHLHIGGARTALFCWAFARRAERDGLAGRFLLRIEDTDQARSSADAAAGILEDLAWLGIRWDEGPEWGGGAPAGGCGGDPRGVGPWFQSERRAAYDACFERLLTAGVAFYAFDTPEELAARRRAAEAEKRTFIYRRPEGYDHAAAAARAAVEPHVVRFSMPAEPITVVDEVLGEVTFPYEELDDFVIRKADGFPTYHFAVVVDDAMMGVTHVLRGQEHLNNTPRHVALFRALGSRPPSFSHMPLIFNVDNTKMSKRDKDKAAKKAVREAGIGSVSALAAEAARRRGAAAAAGLSALSEPEFAVWLEDKQRQLGREQVGTVAGALGLALPEIDVEDFRAAGYLPEVLCNFLALLGWNPGGDVERFGMEFLAERFTLDRIGRSNARFDREKLLAFNADTIQHRMTDAAFGGAWLAWAERFDAALAAWCRADAGRFELACRAARPRSKTLADARGVIAFAFVGDGEVVYDAKSVEKVLRKGEPSGAAVLTAALGALAALEAWTPEAIEACVATLAGSLGVGVGKVAQPLRVALTGGTVSPPLGETLGLIGRTSAAARVERCVREACGA